MTETNSNGFGITTETQSSGATPMQAGIQKAALIEVKFEEIGKDTKYNVLSFSFKDSENIKSFKKSFFQITDAVGTDDYTKKMNGFNSAIKHIFEAFFSIPTAGIGNGATSYDDYFQKIADSFNTSRDGKSIFTKTIGDKEVHVPIWLKVVYNKKNNLDLPLFPNFIEGVNPNNIDKPKTLSIDLKYDIMEQTKPSGTKGATMGGSSAKEEDYAF